MRTKAMQLPSPPKSAAEMISLLDMAIETAKDLNRQLDEMHEFLEQRVHEQLVA